MEQVDGNRNESVSVSVYSPLSNLERDIRPASASSADTIQKRAMILLLGHATFLEVMVQRGHAEDTLLAELVAADLEDHAGGLGDEDPANDDQQEFLLDEQCDRSRAARRASWSRCRP
jgi:hypothetical protein